MCKKFGINWSFWIGARNAGCLKVAEIADLPPAWRFNRVSDSALSPRFDPAWSRWLSRRSLDSTGRVVGSIPGFDHFGTFYGYFLSYFRVIWGLLFESYLWLEGLFLASSWTEMSP